jgi:hypothetical protein
LLALFLIGWSDLVAADTDGPLSGLNPAPAAMAAVAVALLGPWLLSWWLLWRSRSMLVWFFGTFGVSGVVFALVNIPLRPIEAIGLWAIALLPALFHQLKAARTPPLKITPFLASSRNLVKRFWRYL